MRSADREPRRERVDVQRLIEMFFDESCGALGRRYRMDALEAAEEIVDPCTEALDGLAVTRPERLQIRKGGESAHHPRSAVITTMKCVAEAAREFDHQTAKDQ